MPKPGATLPADECIQDIKRQKQNIREKDTLFYMDVNKMLEVKWKNFQKKFK